MRKIAALLIMVMLAVSVKGQLNTERLMSVGRSALYFQDYVLSIQYFSKVIQVKPNLSDPYFYRAVAKIQLEDFDGAKKDLDSFMERNPFSPMAYYARCYVACQAEDWESAEKDIKMALEYSPDNVTYRINLVNIYEEQEKTEEAMAVLDKMIRQSPKWTELHLEKMGLMLQQGDTLGTMDIANRLIDNDKHNSQVYGARAIIHIFLNHEDSALLDCNKAIELGTKNPGTYINRGIINTRLNKFRDAMSDYDKAVELDGENVSALFNRALLRSELGDYNNALDDLDKIVKLKKDLDEAIYERGVINSILGNTIEAIEDFTKIIERHPDFVPVYYARAEQYDKLRKVKAAFADREKAYNLMEDHKKGKKKESTFNADAKIAQEESIIESVSNLFLASQKESATESGVRGLVQNQKIDLTNEPNYVVSFYRIQAKDNLLCKEYDPIELQDFTKRYLKGKELYMVTREIPLSGDVSDYYFSEIDGLSRTIVGHPGAAAAYMLRGLDYAVLQDYQNAIDDMTKAILCGMEEGMVYFMRATMRYRQWEIMVDIENHDNKLKEKMLSNEWELIIRDLDRAAELMPEAGFVWYNKGNMLAQKRDLQAAVSCYAKAIELEPNLGEAYFNRGLTYMLLNQIDKAASDMSKAGEEGIYRAYRILKELRGVQ